AQADLAGVIERLGSPVFVGGQAVSALGDGELSEVIVEPPHRDLDEGDRCRHLDLAPDHRVAVAQFDADGDDLKETVEGSAACGRLMPPVWQAGPSSSRARGR